MATIHFTTTTSATPEQFIAAVTDFGPGRSELFGNTDDGQLKVHDQGPDWADVTEGKTTDSNTWGGASGHTYTFDRRADGTTGVDVVVVREGKNLKGHVIGALLGLVGKRVFSGQFEKTVKAIEARPAV